MKKLLIALALLLPVAFAAPAICSPTVTDTGGIDYGIWTGSGFTCPIGDKVFSNFVPGAAPGDTTLRVQTYGVGGQDVYSVMFGGIFNAPFSISYDVVIVSGPEVFKRVSADLIGTADLGQPMLVKQVYSMDPTTHVVNGLLGGMTAFTSTPPAGGCSTYPCQPLYLGGNVTALHIVDTFTPNSGVANSIGNAYIQGVPEPATMALLGAGLVALSFLRRRS